MHERIAGPSATSPPARSGPIGTPARPPRPAARQLRAVGPDDWDLVESIRAVRLPGAEPCPGSIDRDQLDCLLTEYRFDGAGLAWLAALRPRLPPFRPTGWPQVESGLDPFRRRPRSWCQVERGGGIMRLSGKTAIVTGGGSGFGAAMARLFAQEGARVVVADIDAAAAERVAAELAGAMAVQADVTRDEDTRRMVAVATDASGRLDILVNNAGVSHWNQKLTEVSEADFDRVYAVNVKSLFWAAKHAVPVMAAQGGGAMVNTASTAGLRPRPGLCWYNGSKGACILITKSMAIELAPLKIRVNALCPVAGETPLLAHFLGGDTPENRARFVGSVPLGRLSTPEDVAYAALYLASDEAEFITGVALEVDGGRCI